jgi:hypothetical protein
VNIYTKKVRGVRQNLGRFDTPKEAAKG